MGPRFKMLEILSFASSLATSPYRSAGHSFAPHPAPGLRIANLECGSFLIFSLRSGIQPQGFAGAFLFPAMVLATQ